jgi:SlyX protein
MTMMTDTLQARIEALEIHVAHQDATVEDLNGVILAQREELDRLTRRINRMMSQVDELEAAAPAPEVTKPPHY